MAQADFSAPLLGIVFLKGRFYLLFSLILDLAGLAALLMLGGLLVRRFLVKPDGLETIRDDYVVHGLLFAILVTGFAAEGVRMAATELVQQPHLAVFSPVGKLFAQLFVGMTTDHLSVAHKVLWWVHLFLALGFIAAVRTYIPGREDLGIAMRANLPDQSVTLLFQPPMTCNFHGFDTPCVNSISTF